jgi:hypothetical protein
LIAGSGLSLLRARKPRGLTWMRGHVMIRQLNRGLGRRRRRGPAGASSARAAAGVGSALAGRRRAGPRRSASSCLSGAPGLSGRPPPWSPRGRARPP